MSEEQMQKPVLLSSKEASEYLHVGERTLWQLKKDKKIVALQVSPQKVLYRPEDLDAYLESVRTA